MRIRAACLERIPRLPTATGAIVMAVGVFGAAALQRIPNAGADLTKPIAAAVAAAWLAIASLILLSAAKDGISVRTDPVVESFAIGTWVAGSAMMGRMAMLAAPTALWLAKAAFIVSVGIWLWFIPRALRNLAFLLAAPELRPNGIVLLSTVATQAVALVALRLYPAAPEIRWSAMVLLGMGAACYLIGLFLIVRRYVADMRWRLATDWDNNNCILHGGLSITGLTAVTSGLLDVWGVTLLWICTSIVFILVESIEVARAVERLRTLGWHDGIVVYDISQWARNFTFGMFYAFTVAFAERFAMGQRHPLLNGLREQVLSFGQYLVLLFLIAELVLMLLSSTKSAGRNGAVAPAISHIDHAGGPC
jgi:hypothetical protein